MKLKFLIGVYFDFEVYASICNCIHVYLFDRTKLEGSDCLLI